MNKYLDYIIRFFTFSNDSASDGKNKTSGTLTGKHITAKILAIIMAVGLWLYVMNEQNPPLETRYTVPLEIRNVPSNYVVIDSPGNVSVRIRGPRILVGGITSADIRSYVDLTGLSEGRHNLSVHSLIPSSFELVENVPETVLLRLDPIITRSLPVVVDFSGALPKTVSISRVNAKLSEATVKGPKHLVDTIDRLAATLDVTGKTKSFSAEAPLVPVGKNNTVIEELTVSPRVTQIQIDIDPIIVKKTMQIKPDFTGQLPPRLTLQSIVFEPQAIEVRETSGTANIIEKHEFIYTAPINLSEITRNTSKKVEIIIPEGLTSSTTSVTAQIQVSK